MQRRISVVVGLQFPILCRMIVDNPPIVQVMRKMDLIRKNMVESVKNERNILAMANNPFVVCTAHHIASFKLLCDITVHSYNFTIGTFVVCLYSVI